MVNYKNSVKSVNGGRNTSYDRKKRRYVKVGGRKSIVRGQKK